MALSFENDIKPLFTEDDLMCMSSFGFDLSDYDDVVEVAEMIYERVEDRSMPPDEPWPDDRIALFRQWIDEGMPA